MFRKWYLIFQRFFWEMREKNISAYAASTAFFLFMSIVPILVVVCTVLPFTPLTEENLMEVVIDATPEAMDGLAIELIEEVYQKSAGVLSVAIIVAVWSAGMGVLALRRGLNVINEVPERRNYFLVRALSSFYTLVMLLIMLLSLAVMVFGNQLAHVLLRKVPQLHALAILYMRFRFLFVWAVLTWLFAIIYAFLPDKKMRLREQIPGACFAAIIWSIFSWGFSIYVSRPGAYSIYGSLSIIVISMFWIYFCMYIILIGAYINQYFYGVNQVLMGTRR